MSTSELTYDDLVAELKVDEIQALGDAIGAHLRWAGAVAVAYQPGNGTRYDLVFAPFYSIEQHDPEDIVPAGLRDAPDDEIRRGWTIVSKVNGRTWSYPFDLSTGNRAHAGYVAGHGPDAEEFADAVALTALFRAIAEVDLFDEPR